MSMNEKTNIADTTDTNTFKSNPYLTKFLLCNLTVSFVCSIISSPLK